MAEAVEALGDAEMGVSDHPKKSLKRKRVSPVAEAPTQEDRKARIGDLRAEMEGLFRYFEEVLGEKVDFEVGQCGSMNAVVAVLLEESRLPLSKLVNEVYEKVKEKNNGGGVTLATVKSSVLLVGQRLAYGVPNADADVLEDESASCLWCWETRDLKLMSKSLRALIKSRRTCRKKIHERIGAVSSMINVLEKPDSDQNYKYDLTKASEKFAKVLNEADIRLLMESMVQKDGAKMAEKDVKREEKFLIKQLERNKREVEKKKKLLERELQKEKLLSEKELKRLQDEAEKDERRREREESEMQKQLKKQQEEAEKEQRRREKEEAVLKKQRAIQKQASIMERFVKRNKNNSISQNDQSSTKATTSYSSPNKSEKMPESVTLSMDLVLSSKHRIDSEEIRKSHLASWCYSGRSNRKQHWGIRQKPKTELVKELKLTGSRGLARDDESSIEKLVDGWEETTTEDRLFDTNAYGCLSDAQKCNHSKQLFQFDKSHRPAFYGIWPKKSQIVGPRCPFKKDPDLDYDIDSDEEWEEEDPGESLSDCDKDDEEESVEEGYLKGDDNESEDDFMVPDGYLSENEGIEVDKLATDPTVEEARSSPGCGAESESEEFCVLLRQQKHLHNLTERALRKNQPLIILNLMHEKVPLLMAEDLSGTPKLEQMCLQALSMCAFHGGPLIEISVTNDIQDDDQEACLSNSKGNATTPLPAGMAISDSDLPKIVSTIQGCSLGINKLAESLLQKFPAVPKSHLRSKVREISEFVDNRWQVKKDVLDKLGLSISPEKGGRRTKSIAAFFSKRCLPPSDGISSSSSSSPSKPEKPAAPPEQQTEKPAAVVQLQEDCIYIDQ